MKAEKLLEHIKYLQNEWYESEIENLRLRDQVEELEMQLTPTRNALAKAIKESKQKDAEIQQKVYRNRPEVESAGAIGLCLDRSKENA